MVIADNENFPMAIIGGYQSAQATVLALVRGEVECACVLLSVAIPFVQSGQIRPILTIGPERYQDFPDIQTLAEIGYPDLVIMRPEMWFMASPGVPKDRVQILEDAFMKTLKDPEFLGWAKGAEVEIDPLSGEETTRMVLKFFGLVEQYKGNIEKYLIKK